MRACVSPWYVAPQYEYCTTYMIVLVPMRTSSPSFVRTSTEHLISDVPGLAETFSTRVWITHDEWVMRRES